MALSKWITSSTHQWYTQWPYMIFVAGAPLAHWAVTASKQWPAQKRFWWGWAAVFTALMVGNRLYWWHDAGYAGDERAKWWGELQTENDHGVPRIGTYSKETWGHH
ncbi:hypothetical protein M427DRAFT_153414 [Gonapodya prolifera JEL478]|uniref:Uncharacterized protein n=1 Tax=Gonapodya prolifera (strain JEL478) TaxID=1344416 RepID=A0A139AP59_GONPJ|nr:hypothetical protein M427DRAFT_153414 [Gonapodya prolifera JEL478]|eukprot:KXS18275.1 hypothetical protein M427DRAFT_153414 [Gonapodya prolifera JEL478]